MSQASELERNRTKRLDPVREPTDEQRERWARKGKTGRARLVSLATRRSRKVRAHLRSVRRVGGKAKHQKHFVADSDGQVRMNKRHRTLDGSPLASHVEVRPDEPYEARATAPRPWSERKRRRAANRRRRIGRRNARR